MREKRLYTLEEARQIIAQEETERKEAHKIRVKYYIRQKIIGLFFIVIALAIPLLTEGDATTSLIFVPFGIYLMTTKEKIII